ncbi:hypothetical protein FH972_023894 [Carpinus fangiana]|uniref:Lon protease homolog, mitochondrial n=1 Tax=Carpinus fangiana TaxID=176857 RepID=A0A5N6KWI4_9ROSI|nr:hypothetical protein FH972_023894 [Carpinus fangiana]
MTYRLKQGSVLAVQRPPHFMASSGAGLHSCDRPVLAAARVARRLDVQSAVELSSRRPPRLANQRALHTCGDLSGPGPSGRLRTITCRGMSAKAYKSHEERTSTEPRESDLHSVTIDQIQPVHANVKLFKLGIAQGQWLDVHVPGLQKAGGFTITSSPHEAQPMAKLTHVELAVQYSPKNPPAAWLWQDEAKVLGQKLHVRVGGSFTWPPPNINVDAINHVVLVAGGVGINPLMSMVSHFFHPQSPGWPHIKIDMLYTTKLAPAESLHNILFLPRLRELAAKHPDQFRLWLHLTDVTRRVERHDLEQILGEEKERTLCYVCGPQRMTDEVVDTLASIDGMHAADETTDEPAVDEIDLVRGGTKREHSHRLTLMDAPGGKPGLARPSLKADNGWLTSALRTLAGTPHVTSRRPPERPPFRPAGDASDEIATMQAPMISSPLKQTNEIDWIHPLKLYIRSNYGDDPERYAEECATLQRLRQDMRGAGKDSAAGRDLLYRYYGQLELLDLRFDAFTQKPTSQHSLAFEKASIIFNIAAVLSCHAAIQNRHEDHGLKTAYHSFQAAAGMFTYINENFLHAPSTDLHHDTIRTLINIMLAQAQEVFLERQMRGTTKSPMLAKMASQAAYLWAQAVEGVQDNVSKSVFEKVWLLLAQCKAAHLASVSLYYQALADDDSGNHGAAIARLQAAEKQAKDATRAANGFPNSVPTNSNLGSETGPSLIELTKKHLATVSDKIPELIKDNDFIYHQPIPNEAALPDVAKMPAAKAITVGELYQGQDVQRIIGPDIFHKIVPMSVTESASLYDEEKAKLIRAETDRVEIANGEMAASLDYLKLPSSLNVLKGGMDQEMAVDEEFKRWCDELAGHTPFGEDFDRLSREKTHISSLLEQSSKQLDMEESVCEKMRSKYGAEWTQQPSSRSTATLRSDIKNYLSAVEEATTSDAQLSSSHRQYESDFDEMRSAGEAGEADVLYQRALIKAGASRNGKSGGSPLIDEGNLLDDDFDEGDKSVAEQIAHVEDLLRKLNLIKREREQVLKDLKEKIRNDDISQVLILSKKAITDQDHAVFKEALEKFRPHQQRLLQANHKQSSVMKELTRAYSNLLQDKRIRGEQAKYEAISRQRNAVMSKYRKVSHAFGDLQAGLERAQQFYAEMRSTVESLSQNVTSFVGNRKSEGGELLNQIEKKRGEASGADQDKVRLSELMSRMNVASPQPAPQHRPAPLQNIPSYHQTYNPATSPPLSGHFVQSRQAPMQSPYGGGNHQGHHQSIQQGLHQGGQERHQGNTSSVHAYNPNHYGHVSPPPTQQAFAPAPASGYQSPPPNQQHYSIPPAGYVPPPPPPGPPPASPPARPSQPIMITSQRFPWRPALRHLPRQGCRLSSIATRPASLGARASPSLRLSQASRLPSASRHLSSTPFRRKDKPSDSDDPSDILDKTEKAPEKKDDAEDKAKREPTPIPETISAAKEGDAATAGPTSGDGGGDSGRKGRNAQGRALQKPSVPEVYPQVMAIPIAKRPLFPGFYKAITINDPNVAAAIQEMMRRGQPYIGAFLFKDEGSDKDTIQSMDEVHDVGTFCQITSAFPVHGEERSLTAVLYPHRRIKMSSLTPPGQMKTAEAVVENVVEGQPKDEKDADGKDKSGDVVASFEESNRAEESKLAEERKNVQIYEPNAFLKNFAVSLVNVDNLTELAHDKKNSTIKALTSEIINVFREIAGLSSLFRDQISTFSMSQSVGNVAEDPGKLADFAAAVSSGDTAEMQEVLEALNIEERLSKALVVLKKELLNAQLQSKISKDVENKIQKRQRDYWLMEQRKAINKELGIESDGKDKLVEKFKEKANKLAMPEAVKKVFDEELSKLATLEPAASEFNVTRNYLDWLTQIPWGQRSAENFGIKNAMTVLDEDHHGLRDVKDRILEFIAVGKLRGTVEGKILCFVGPPGVGKTSIGKSIARALNRQYYRFSVGGLTDVAEIKGHRRTYVGALPGRIIQALKKCQTENPLILIDEVDKIGRGVHGDPSSALLELLDPEQNGSFLDHYMDVPVDLSKVLFVCTANMTDTIPRPLLDRMEMIELSGYVADEKMAIADRYLAPTAKELAGLKDADVNLDKDAILELINKYCRESGVRNLKKQIEKVFRKSALKIVQDVGEDVLSEDKALTQEGKEASEAAKKDETDVKETPENIEAETTETPRVAMKIPDSVHVTINKDNLKDYVGPPVFTADRLYDVTPPGVAMGLAWTSMGGAALYIESILQQALSASSSPGLESTGNLKNVMKESTQIAYSFVKSLMARDFPGNRFFEKAKLHLHCPEGAVQKDGPSAGITMSTALLSLALDYPLDPTIAMTGELTVTGKVLRIGGLREKTVAAKRAGAKMVIFPTDNESDWLELPENIKEGISGKPVSWYNEVFDLVFADLDRTKAGERWKQQLAAREKDDKDD